MATISVGNIKFNWKGPWSNSTNYSVDDVVSLSGASYISIQAGSNQNPASASAYWQQMSSAGTNGTDLTTTLTTQGDMLYRDGSGLQRLAKGTASQELRMNSGATAPEWHTPAVASSDFVKLHTISSTSNVTNYNFTGYFNDTLYKYYKFVGHHRMASGQSGTNAHTIVRWMVNGSELSTSDYNYAWVSTYRHNGSNGNQANGGHNESFAYLGNTWNESTAYSPHYYDMTIINTDATNNIRGSVFWTNTSNYQSNNMFSGTGGMNNEGTNADANTKITGLSFRYQDGQNFGLMDAVLYGVKR